MLLFRKPYLVGMLVFKNKIWIGNEFREKGFIKSSLNTQTLTVSSAVSSRNFLTH